MYDTFFGFKRRPFSPLPQAEQYYPASSIEAARIALIRCIDRGEGIGMIIGPTGTGKTLLCRLLSEQCKKTLAVSELSCGRLSTRRSLYQAILYGLGQPYRIMDEGELRLSLVDYLTLGKAPQNGMALIVDEAHTLPLRLLDEIRMLTNLSQKGLPLVRFVLAGNGSLEERFAGPRMESFSQRISTRCYLEALNRSETQDYIHSQINWAGGNSAIIFPEPACQSVHQATDGVPRLINQLCDHVFLVAYVAGCKVIGPEKVEEAWADLQQLPTPWNGENKQDAGGVIEFGDLDESVEETPQANDGEEAAFSLRVAENFDDFQTQSSDLSLDGQSFEIGSVAEESDFQPVLAIKPEVELTFTESDLPFEEEFQQEEIVADRYASSKALNLASMEQQPAEAISLDWKTIQETQLESLMPEGIIEENKLVAEESLVLEAFNEDEEADIPTAIVEEATSKDEFIYEQTESLELDFDNPAHAIKTEPPPIVPYEKDQELIHTKPMVKTAASRKEYSRLFAKLRQR